MTHWEPDRVSPRSSRMAGRATRTIVMSSVIMMVETAETPRLQPTMPRDDRSGSALVLTFRCLPGLPRPVRALGAVVIPVTVSEGNAVVVEQWSQKSHSAPGSPMQPQA